MPSIAARICQCGHAVGYGKRCECQRREEKPRPGARERGYDTKWERESKAFLALPGNERCACGCGRVANCVDHRVAHKGDRRLFWDRANWRPMHRRCNSRKAVREEGGFGRPPGPPC